MTFARRLLATSLVGLAAATLAPVAGAQQVYRIVGPDGRVTFSDKPPADPAARTAANTPAPAAASGGSLPFELRQVASKYPVTLYTGPNCAPCGAGRTLLTGRGIPFAEKTVSTNEDIEALQRLAGDASLPLLTVGGQQIKGYSDTEWGQFLDAAGYPKTSQLPPSFRRQPAAPLVALQRSATPAAAPAAGQTADTADGPSMVNRRAAGQRPSAPATAPANPAGIQF